MSRRNRFVKPRRVLGSLLLTVATFAVFLAVVWHAWQNNADKESRVADVPVVRAGEQVYKIKPADEGGLDIPFQELEVFEGIESSQSENKTKIVFLSEEENKDKEINIEPDLPDIKAEDVLSKEFNDLEGKPEKKTVETYDLSTKAEPIKTSVPEPVAEKEDIVETIKENLIAEKPEEKQETEPEPVPAPEPEPKIESIPSVTQSGDYVIQLGAVRSEEAVQTEWKRISRKTGDLLNSLTLHTEKADLGEKGVFYRIQAGKTSKENAQKLCDEIKASKAADCIVKKAGY